MISLLMRALRCGGVAMTLMPGALLAQEVLSPQKVADGVYALVGETADVSATNYGFVGNSGFIVGPSGVVVIDTGISYRHGRRLLETIAHITDKRVELVIVTHAVQEFLFGNAAFEERG